MAWKIPEAPQREVMNLAQTAAFLGIARDTLYQYAADGFVPAFKMGNRWKFLRSSLESWMHEQEKKGGKQ